MTAELIQMKLGPWPMNGYGVLCTETGASAVIDPGAEPNTILLALAGTRIEKILLTHGHSDHVGAVEAVKAFSGAPVCMHPADAAHFGLDCDIHLEDGSTVAVGNLALRVIHVPGHTPGQVCFDLGEGCIISGDTIFVGGPGKTWSAADFATTMKTMQQVVFKWPDATEFFPGHGPSGTIGQERPAYEAFLTRGWPGDLYGDVTWG